MRLFVIEPRVSPRPVPACAHFAVKPVCDVILHGGEHTLILAQGSNTDVWSQQSVSP
jgi:hypothetical protein